MNEVKKKILMLFLVGILAVNVTNVSLIGEPPGWIDGDYLSIWNGEV